jgi:hypothetical protein
LARQVDIVIEAQAELATDLARLGGQFQADLGAKQPLVMLGEFHFLHRQGCRRDEGAHALIDVRRDACRNAVKTQVVRKHQIGGEPRIGHAPRRDADQVAVTKTCIGTVERNGVAIVVVAHGLVGRQGVGGAAGGQAHAC